MVTEMPSVSEVAKLSSEDVVVSVVKQKFREPGTDKDHRPQCRYLKYARYFYNITVTVTMYFKKLLGTLTSYFLNVISQKLAVVYVRLVRSNLRVLEECLLQLQVSLEGDNH